MHTALQQLAVHFVASLPASQCCQHQSFRDESADQNIQVMYEVCYLKASYKTLEAFGSSVSSMIVRATPPPPFFLFLELRFFFFESLIVSKHNLKH